MEEVKLSTRVLLVSAVILIVVLITGPLGYKFGLVPLQPSLVSLLVAVFGGALVVLVGLYYLFVSIKGGLAKNRNLLLVAMVLSLIPAIVMLPQMAKARSVPPIHDITTDPENPPAFVAIKPLRANAPNGVEYGANENWPAEKLAATTREAYPDLMPIRTEMTVIEAVEKSASVLRDMGLEVVAEDVDDGRVEATATTTWFGFKDDVVVRIAGEEDSSLIDLRSMSRVGQSDVGVNADRIREFTARFGR